MTNPTDIQETANAPSAEPRRSLGAAFSVLLRAVIPMAILIGGYFVFAKLSQKPESTKAEPTEKQLLRTRVTELRIEDYPVTIKTNGIVQPHDQITVNSQVSGQISSVNPVFEVGSYFSEGDVLVELDASDYANSLAVAKASYLAAWSNLELQTENLARETELFRKSYGSQASVSRANASREQASAQLDSASALVERAERDLERTKIRAPFDGRVRTKTVGLGQRIAAGTSLGTIFAVDYAEVRLPIAGRELEYLSLPELPGDEPVDVELSDALSKDSKTKWSAKIVRTEGALNSDSLELFAIARVDDPFGRETGEPPLRIGQPVVATIKGKTLDDVVALPRGAVRQLDQIFLVDKDELTLISKTIRPIWKDGAHIIVRDATIQDGALLATTRLVFAPDGAKVEILPNIEVTTADAELKSDTKSVTN